MDNAGDGLHEEKPARRACLAASAALFGRDKRAGARRMRGWQRRRATSGAAQRTPLAGARRARREGCRFCRASNAKSGAKQPVSPLAARPEPLPAFLRVSKRLAPKPWQPGSRKTPPPPLGKGPSRTPPMASMPADKKTASSKQKEAALLFAGVFAHAQTACAEAVAAMQQKSASLPLGKRPSRPPPMASIPVTKKPRPQNKRRRL